MFQRLREAREREGGFTLIELLVVVIIIAILAAIAIPVFLNQRKKGWQAQAESAVKNAATAMETWAAENGGSYLNGTESKLVEMGFNQTAAVELTVERVSATSYCVLANHDSLTTNVYFSAESGKPVTAATCPAAPA